MYRYQLEVQEATAKVQMENEQRLARGQQPLSEEEATKNIQVRHLCLVLERKAESGLGLGWDLKIILKVEGSGLRLRLKA